MRYVIQKKVGRQDWRDWDGFIETRKAALFLLKKRRTEDPKHVFRLIKTDVLSW